MYNQQLTNNLSEYSLRTKSTHREEPTKRRTKLLFIAPKSVRKFIASEFKIKSHCSSSSFFDDLVTKLSFS